MLIKLIKKTSNFHESFMIYNNQLVELTLQYVLLTIYIYIYKFNNVDQKTTYFNENCCIIYIYIYTERERAEDVSCLVVVEFFFLRFCLRITKVDRFTSSY